MIVAFLGPNGSFTEQVALNSFSESDLVAVNSIGEIFEGLEQNKFEKCVVPIENSIHGKVIETIDNLKKYDFRIVKELKLEIHNQFCSKENDLKNITKIYSKDVAYNQCKVFLREKGIVDIPFVPVESTSKAASIVANEKGTAAICSKIAVKQYGLNILFENIEDTKNNETRFVVLGKNGTIDNESDSKSGNKISLIAKLENVPGALYKFLKVFYEGNINMTSIESRPDRDDENFTYWFYIEITGNIENDAIKKLLKENKKNIKFLGNY